MQEDLKQDIYIQNWKTHSAAIKIIYLYRVSLSIEEPTLITNPKREREVPHTKIVSFYLIPKLPPYFHALHMDRIFPTSYAATWNQTHISSVASPRGTIILDALPTELPRLQD